MRERRVGDRLGPYLLQQPLDEVDTGQRWLALEESSQRELLLRLLPLPQALPDGLPQWLPGLAPAVGLQHPHLQVLRAALPLDGVPVLAYDVVGGSGLATWLTQHGPVPLRAALRWLAELASALQALHGQAVVHGAVALAAVSIDALGRLRLGNLGCARHPPPGGAGGAGPSVAQDLQDSLSLLAVMLVGRPLQAGEGLVSVLQALPTAEPAGPRAAPVGPGASAAGPGEGGDAALRQHLLAAASAGPQAGFADAASLCAAVLAWLLPTGAASDAGAEGQGTLGVLLQRMQRLGDFPALSVRVQRIQRLAGSESAPLQQLTEEILQDVALTQKLLRLVNTAHFRREAHGVATVSRAVALVGLAGIRNLSLSLVLVDHLHDRAHAQRLKQAFLRALLAGQLAHALAETPQEAEEAFLGGLFHNLGGLLVECYLPEAAEAVRLQVTQRLAAPGARPWSVVRQTGLQEQVAAEQLGLGFATLGMAVARHWQLPESLQQCMLPSAQAAPGRRLPAGPERLRWLAAASSDTALALWTCGVGTPGNETALSAQLEAVVQRYGRALGLSLDGLRQAVQTAWLAVAQMAPAMGLSLSRLSPSGVAPGKALPPGVDPAPEAPPAGVAQSAVVAASVAVPAGLATPPVPTPVPAADIQAALAMLSAGMLDITDALASEQVRLNDVLRQVLETLYRALGCRRVLLCLREADGRRLVGRFGLGDGVMAHAAQLQVVLRPPPGQALDLLAQACVDGHELWLDNPLASGMAERLPLWVSQGFRPGSCVVLPLRLRGAPLALIYADHTHSRPISEPERLLLRSLRNQALLAFRLAG